MVLWSGRGKKSNKVQEWVVSGRRLNMSSVNVVLITSFPLNLTDKWFVFRFSDGV